MNNLDFICATELLKNQDMFSCYVSKIYMETKFLATDYPEYYNWYYTTVIPGIFNGTRNIFLATTKNREIIGIAIAKKDEKEKKLCTLWVKEEYRHRRVATMLLHKVFQYLGTTTPLFTVSEKKVLYFTGLIRRYKWVHTNTLKNYNLNGLEYVYNQDPTKDLYDEEEYYYQTGHRR